MKWGFIPVRRIVDEDENGNFIDEPVAVDTKESTTDVSSTDSTEEYEFRDEKGRPWWKFFDEYEYRVTSKVKSHRKWYKWFADSDTPEEKKLISKVDILLVFYSLMAYIVKYLSQSNLVNAYIGGLKEDINMQGNDLVDTQIMFSIGNIVFQIPFMYILYAWPLSYVLPGLEIGWAILTCCAALVKNTQQLQVVRFLIGSLEAPSYIAYHALFASWYKSSTGEISRRAGIYYLGQYLGLLISGLLSGAIARSLGGVGGYAAWQWIFMIDGFICLFVAFLGFYMIPGTPQDCYSAFLTDDDIRVARRRMKADQKSAKPRENPTKQFFDLKIWKSIFTSWHFYVVGMWNVFCWNNSNGGSGAYALWLKSLINSNGTPRYGPGQVQDMTALTPGLGLIWLILVCSFADLFQSRWGAILFSQVFNVLGNVLLAVWYIPEGAKWFAWCLQYFGWAMAPVLYSWQGDICRKDIRERNVVLVAMNIFASQSTAWISKLVWPTVEAPRFLKGFTFTACSGFTLCIWTMLVLYLYKREEKANAKENGIIIYDSSKQDLEEIQRNLETESVERVEEIVVNTEKSEKS
ncbi:SEO1 Probable transporter SEO1 [Candida maltosa Xu316]